MSYSPAFFNQNSGGNSKATGSQFQNVSGSTLAVGTPVCVNASSQLILVDVSDEAAVKAIVGVAGDSIPNAASGQILDNGRLQNITTSFAVRSVLYIDKSGALTDQAPEIGTAGFTDGDFVVLVGVVVKNEFNPSNKDLKLMISVIGQL